MFDHVPLQRSHGEARIAIAENRIAALRQSGSAKVMLPRTHSGMPELVFLNTSGGLTGGDRLTCSVHLGAGTRARATTQTAERAYRSDGGQAEVRVTLAVGPGARLDWLPQETILFEGSALHRQTSVELDAGACFLGVETLVLGRAAMGETLARVALDDIRTIRRQGRLLLVDPFRLTDASLGRSGGPALLGGARAVATLILVAPEAEQALPGVRAVLDEPDVDGAASALEGRLVLRCRAPDAWPLRRQMLRLIDLLCPGGAPRCWQT